MKFLNQRNAVITPWFIFNSNSEIKLHFEYKGVKYKNARKKLKKDLELNRNNNKTMKFLINQLNCIK